MKKLIIYLLLSFGFVIMILPFAWMLVTSFKLPSEVQEWPPKWHSKNFFTHREVKVNVKLGAVKTVKGISLSEALSFTSSTNEVNNVLNIVVDDDPFYRGTLFIDTKNFDYIEFADVNAFKNWLNNVDNFANFSTETPEKFFEEVFLYYKSGPTPYFQRLNYYSNLAKRIDGALQGIKLIERFIDRRIKDENERERFREFLKIKGEEIQNVKEELSKYKSGKYLILTDEEIENIYKTLNKLNLNYDGENELLNVYNSKVVNVFDDEITKVKFYLDTINYFKNIQTKKIDKPIIAKSISKSEKIKLLKEELKKFEDVQLLSKVISEYGYENLPENFSKSIDTFIKEKYNISSSQLIDLKSLTVTFKNVLINNKIDYKQILSKGSLDTLLDYADLKLLSSSTYRIFKSKLETYSHINNLHALVKDLIVYSDYLDQVRRVYNNSLNAWKIVEAPSFVKAVRVKNGEVIEVELEGVSPIYLSDNSIKKVSLSFSFGETLANIFQNYVDAWRSAPFGRYYFNTVLVATVTTILEIILASMAAYAFSWMNFPGRNFIFGLFLATMMVPGEVLLVPNFITISKFGWIDTYYALIVPWIVSVFAIFLMRQHFLALPKELFDAAKIDGCSHWKFLWQIVVPLSKPVIITGALLKFVGSWNAFLWVLIVTNSDKFRTLPVGLQNFSSDVGTLYNQLMAAATFSILPVIILFLLTQKYFIRGIARTGLK
ncbi:carbohydrate ABC transporter permease [Thermosipho atlanticus]|uniref:Carbohydrate ABC transporter membrane protein 2, CUT1 family n=1 Tax=Thermosipho atlanticus DSM 15807 TaxID=1123380 RepID=A0A1M5R8Z7_9BACT|nr:carbohydrate ABC transporter permease [Thermosipho atlanticus]SHH22805.1 carbohydrate ABC transporter membrane protein 2, CUT1 family [Thermosipho atlanticus DSM 15807]